MIKRIGSFLTILVFGWAGSAAAASITDIVAVNGKEWAQVDLFIGLSWDDINAVCPVGVCGSGTLNGYEMAGWSWATTDDLNTLFNHYIGFAAVGPGPDEYFDDFGTFADLFFADGWRITGDVFGHSKSTAGLTADTALIWAEITSFHESICGITCPGQIDRNFVHTNSNQDFVSITGDLIGAWFKRTTTEVPVPATLPLVGLALAVLRYRQRIGAK